MIFEKDVMISRFLKLKKKTMTIKTLRIYFNKILTAHDMSIWKLKLKEQLLMHYQIKRDRRKKKLKKLPLARMCSSY